MRNLPYAICLAFLSCTIAAPFAHAAADAPGTASGTYRDAFAPERDTTVRYAVAMRTTMVEDSKTTPVIRIVLSDNPVPVSDLKGGRIFPPFVDLPKSTRPEAIIIDYVPGAVDGTRIATLIADPDEVMSGYQSHSQTSDGPFEWQRIVIEGNMVEGVMKKGEYDFRFAAQIVDDPVTEQLKSPQAQAHPINSVWSQSVNAILAGDATLARSLLSQRASTDPGRNTPEYWPELIKSYRANRATMLKAAKFERVVVRGDRATGISQPAPGTRITVYFSLEDGVWKLDG